jgi:hypothetical protein
MDGGKTRRPVADAPDVFARIALSCLVFWTQGAESGPTSNWISQKDRSRVGRSISGVKHRDPVSRVEGSSHRLFTVQALIHDAVGDEGRLAEILAVESVCSLRRAIAILVKRFDAPMKGP